MPFDLPNRTIQFVFQKSNPLKAVIDGGIRVTRSKTRRHEVDIYRTEFLNVYNVLDRQLVQ